MFLLNLFLAILWLGVVIIPMAIGFNYDSQPSFKFVDIFTFSGALETSWLFYGGYSETLGRYQMYFAYGELDVVSSGD